LDKYYYSDDVMDDEGAGSVDMRNYVSWYLHPEYSAFKIPGIILR
jgi:hypothetical protein